MDKIKRFIDCYIPTETCNLRCKYCYIMQQRKFNNKLAKFKYSTDEIKKALSVERLGGKCLLNLCAGGETLLSHEVIAVTKALLEEGHYVMIVTNGTLTKRFNEIIEFDSELLERLFFKFSFHYLELLNKNMIDIYFENINKVKSKGCSFTVEMTPNDELIPHIEDIKRLCIEKLGTLCHVTIARDDRTNGIDILSRYSFKEYYKIWSTFESKFFDFKYSIFYKKRKEFCYAGDWSLYINLVSGGMKQCYCGEELDNIYTNIDKPLNFKAIGYGCKLAHCYNGHAFLTIGNIPELKTPTYGEIRNRINNKGESWLNPKMESFMSQKLEYNNKKYSNKEKIYNFINNKLSYMAKVPTKVANKVRNKIGV